MKPYRYYIGIDCGTQTGLGIWDKQEKKLIAVETLLIHRAMERVAAIDCFVRVEDARLRTWFGNAGREQLQGAGSVKRDSKIWEDYLVDHGIPHEMVAPKNNKTKLSADGFARLTKWTARTSVHGRDAAMLVFGF